MADLQTHVMFEDDPVAGELPRIEYALAASGFGTFEMDPNIFVDPNLGTTSTTVGPGGAGSG